MDIFLYGFMKRIFLATTIVSLIVPFLGNIVAAKRYLDKGEELVYSLIFGIMVGLIFNRNHILISVVVTILSTIFLEITRMSFTGCYRKAISVIISFGTGLLMIFVFLAKRDNFNKLLWGNITGINSTEIIFIGFSGITVLILFLVFFEEILYQSFHGKSGKAFEIRSNLINFTFTVMVALVFSVSVRIFGVVVIASLLVFPLVCSFVLSENFKISIILSCILGIYFTFFGIFVSFYTDTRIAQVVFLIAVISTVLVVAPKSVIEKITKKN